MAVRLQMIRRLFALKKGETEQIRLIEWRKFRSMAETFEILSIDIKKLVFSANWWAV